MPNLQAATIERSNTRKMLTRQKNDLSCLEKSPKIRRKFDVPERECQPSVIDRARLTLFNLTDIWKSKIDTHKVHKSCGSPVTANRKALDVLAVWSKHRRSPSAEPASHKRSASIENHTNEHWRSDGKTYIKILNGKSIKSKCNSLAADKSKPTFLSNSNVNKYQIDDLSKESSVYWRQRSYDAGLNYVNRNDKQHDYDDGTSSNSALPKQRPRRRSWGALIPSEMLENRFYANKTYCENRKRGEKPKSNDNHASVVKARLKFKKIKTCDDLYANANASKKPIKLLKRQTSVLPIITVDDCDSQPSANAVGVAKKPNANEQQSDGRPPLPSPSPQPSPVSTNDTIKPRKKLSFREPVIFNEKLQELREKHSIKNQSTAHVQSDDGEKCSSNESMDISQVPQLEV